MTKLWLLIGTIKRWIQCKKSLQFGVSLSNFSRLSWFKDIKISFLVIFDADQHHKIFENSNFSDFLGIKSEINQFEGIYYNLYILNHYQDYRQNILLFKGLRSRTWTHYSGWNWVVHRWNDQTLSAWRMAVARASVNILMII